jgi:hypothetical protein
MGQAGTGGQDGKGARDGSGQRHPSYVTTLTMVQLTWDTTGISGFPVLQPAFVPFDRG